MIETLWVFWDKLESLTPLEQTHKGKFRVIYRDGGLSIKMDWWSACQYAQMFNCDILHIKTKRVLRP